MGSLETLSRLETVSRQYFYCLGLGLEVHCLGLGLGLEPHCLGPGLGLEPHCLGPGLGLEPHCPGLGPGLGTYCLAPITAEKTVSSFCV